MGPQFSATPLACQISEARSKLAVISTQGWGFDIHDPTPYTLSQTPNPKPKAPRPKSQTPGLVNHGGLKAQIYLLRLNVVVPCPEP